MEKTLVKRQVLDLLWQSTAIVALALVLGVGSNWLRSDKLPWVTHWPQQDLLDSNLEDGLVVSLGEAEALYFSRLAVFLDARAPDLYELGHIEGAYNLPWQDFDKRFDSVMGKIPHDSFIITYCDGAACNLSKDLAMALMEKGYENVKVLVNGWTRWQEAELPVGSGGRSESR